MRKDLKTKLVNRKVNRPNPVLMAACLWVLGLLNRRYKVSFSYDYDPGAIQDRPTILLSSHAARLEFIYTVYGFRRRDINVVCGYQNILQKGIYPLFMRIGVISKYLYQPDFMCVKNMLRVLRRNGAIGLFPEGIQSTSGSTHPINPATAKFIKSSRANVVVCTTRGAYLATNRYSSDRKKGPITVEYSLLFTPEQLEALTEEQIGERLLEKLQYNDFAYNRTARNRYVGKKPNAFGIGSILYRCPDCGQEGALDVEGEAVVCRSCGFRARVNEYYDLVADDDTRYPFDIDRWYKWQRRCVAEQIREEGFALELKARLCTLRVDRLRFPPRDRQVLSVGTARLTRDGLSFRGWMDGQRTDLEFSARSLYSMTRSTKGFLEFYYNNDYYILVPEEQDRCLIKWTLAAEEIHNLYDPRWRAACAAVYEYEKEGLLWGDR